MTQHFYMVDVFAEHIYGGNPLAVVVGAEALSDKVMQKIAAEMNFSETTFVYSAVENNGSYRVRIFTPAREIDFTGHPILGTAWIIRQHLCPAENSQIKMNLAVGQVVVTFEVTEDEQELVWFRAPPMSLGEIAPPEPIAQALGISVDDIDTISPIQVISAGTAAIIVPLRSRDALQRCQLNLELFKPLADKGFPPLIYLYCNETHESQNDLSVRFFFEAHGVREDPATGNGAAFLGAYLLEHDDSPIAELALRIEQGYEVRRPSLIMLRANKTNNTSDIYIGGFVIPTFKGELL